LLQSDEHIGHFTRRRDTFLLLTAT